MTRSHRRRLLAAPELILVMAVAGALNLWGLSINGWANTYYSAAVRSMTTSWHDFLFVSFDRSGLMTVDKPPLALWVQALSARIFGFHPLSLLVPQALMGVAAAGLVYDLVRRRFGRVAGAVAGLALATTPVIVAVSRHNNPDELLGLCCTAAVWCLVRGLDDGRTRWLVLAGVCLGLGFETKMAVALMLVPGLAAAWLWAAPRGPRAAVRQLLAGGAALLAVGGAWPLLVTLTPASRRPWISGTSDNSVWSLIFGYNGLGRVTGQTGGPGGGAAPGGGGGGPGATFGGPTGVLRLLQSGLGDQAGWLLGFALVSALGLIVVTRLRRRDPRSAWLVAVGGALAVPAVVFSLASGIFHPYYVSLLAPFTAALVGAGVAPVLEHRSASRWLGPLVVAGGVASEAMVLGGLSGQMSWAWAVLALAGATAAALALGLQARLRATLVAVALAALLAAPAAWAAQTLGHAEGSTFPAGGPADVAAGGGGAGGPFGRGGQFLARLRAAGRSGVFALPSGSAAAGGVPGGAGGPPSGPAGAGGFGGAAAGPPPGLTAGGGAPAGPFGGGAGGPFGGDTATLRSAVRYARAHGGGTIGVESQSSAAGAILDSGADVAGLGGFSGRESSVTASWLAAEVAAGHLRYVLGDGTGQARLPGDTRTGSASAFVAVSRACRAVRLTTATSTTGSAAILYDCQGRAAAIVAASRA